MSNDEKKVCMYCAAWKENGFVAVDGFLGTGSGECRKHAPGRDPDWPQTRSGDWCLEFVERRDDYVGKPPDTWQHISEPVGEVVRKSCEAYEGEHGDEAA